MTRDEAMNEFRALVNRYGVQWNASVPAAIYDRLNKINTVLTERDRRTALGLPNR